MVATTDVPTGDAASIEPPTVDAIRRARAELGDRVVTTPVWRWRGLRIGDVAGAGTEV